MIKQFFNKHFEWMALTLGLVLMAAMNPYVDNGASWCLFDQLGITLCPGEGLGHSIAYFVRGDFSHAMQANVMGPVAILIITGRVFYLLHTIYLKKHPINPDNYG